QVKSREPLVSKYREYTIVGFPPPSSGGVHVAQMLNILEPFDVAAIADKDWAAYLHLMAETMKLAFADRAHWLGDPDFAQVPRGLVEPQYGRELAKRIQMDRTTPVRSHGQPPRAETELFERHTTHIAAADAAGNWVGITATINTTFGSKVVIPGTGVVMNNEMDDFSIQPGVPNAFGLIGAEANAVAPGKRPLSSMSPTIVLRGDQPILTVGAAGGPKIITQVLQTIVRRLDLDMSLYNAVASPRIHHQWSPDRLYVERELADPFVDGLTVRGHAVVRTGGAGVTQAIEYDPDRRQFLGLHDPRVPGQAMGFQARVEAATPLLDPTELVARESLTLKGGKTYQGLLLRRSPGELEFVQVGLPKGKPMFLVRISFDPTSVERYEPLERARRNELFARIRPLLASKRHAVIEAGRMADVRLDPIELDGRTMLRCDSPLFQLVSSADESSTHRCFVRLEQVFRAFQRVLPPRVSPDRPLVIRLHGSADEYHEQLRAEGWDIRNPAFYSASRNMIVAGCDLTFFADRLRRTHEQNEQVREQYTRLNAGLTDRLADLTAELKEAGFSNDEIQREVNARRALWKNELEAALKQIDAVDRRNDARFAEVSGEMFARLKHEAFHAYTRNFVFTQPRAELPVWLNEGLAQVFETAPIDGDRLRIDAPDPERLRR
ncbi:MAG: gamma-glutamyltransferase, partial [Planctomycetales bacterium]|nr:gamma-glutamyltransferase [Planctomycetales bacterium]